MLSKNKIKYIHSLELKKTRKEEQVFLAEGPKLTGDLLGHFPCRLRLLRGYKRIPTFKQMKLRKSLKKNYHVPACRKHHSKYLLFSSNRNIR